MRRRLPLVRRRGPPQPSPRPLSRSQVAPLARVRRRRNRYCAEESRASPSRAATAPPPRRQRRSFRGRPRLHVERGVRARARWQRVALPERSSRVRRTRLHRLQTTRGAYRLHERRDRMGRRPLPDFRGRGAGLRVRAARARFRAPPSLRGRARWERCGCGDHASATDRDPAC